MLYGYLGLGLGMVSINQSVVYGQYSSFRIRVRVWVRVQVSVNIMKLSNAFGQCTCMVNSNFSIIHHVHAPCE